MNEGAKCHNSRTDPFMRLLSQSEWSRFTCLLAQPSARNLFYFGHYDVNTLSLGGSVSVTQLRGLLNNWGNGTSWMVNGHPYRFVFLCACSSAQGDMPLAFGIPKVKMTTAKFEKKYNIPRRAFLGLETDGAWGVHGQENNMSQNLQNFVNTFWRIWPATNRQTGQPYTLEQAVNAANRAQTVNMPRVKVKPVIYGCSDLLF